MIGAAKERIGTRLITYSRRAERSARLLSFPALLLIAAIASLAPQSASACGAETDCIVEGGSYRIYQPETIRDKTKAVMFLHGWQASAAAVMKNTSLRRVADELGTALIAPHGEGKTWSYPGAPRQYRDEFAFFDALSIDVYKRFGIMPSRTVVSGFSMGGSMVWNLACARGDRYRGFAPIAGAFWEPLPDTCETVPDILLHTHGISDTVVPIEGRPIGTQWRQGDTWASFRVLTKGDEPDTVGLDVRALICTSWKGEGKLLRFCRHGGGHIYEADWVREAWDVIEELS
ncbi:MAG: polyhydroxybutyrate depolymerase [Pseudomonadota bacterium]